MPLLVVVITALTVAQVAVAQPPPPEGRTVANDDPLYPLLAGHQSRITARHVEGGVSTPRFSSWRWIDRAPTAGLFPRLRFAAVTWDEVAVPGKESLASRAAMRRLALAIDPDTPAIVSELEGDGNYDAFGTLLTTAGVRLRNAADAGLIWDAFCAIHAKSWTGYPHQQVDESHWRLGHYSYDRTVSTTERIRVLVTQTQFMRVRTDAATGAVQSWEAVVETGNRRMVRVRPPR